MQLSKKFNSLALGVVLGATALTMGCAQQIGVGNAAPELRGTVVEEILPVSGAAIMRIHLDGKNLQAGKSYKFNKASLTIDGDVPPGTSITGYGGQILVTGNVRDGAELKVRVPELSHQKPYPCMAYNITLKMPENSICHETVYDGPKPPFDKDPVIIVKGRMGIDVITKRLSFDLRGK